MSDITPQQILVHCRAWSQRAANLQRTARVTGVAPRVQHASPLASISDDLEMADYDSLGAIVAGLTVCLIQRNNEFTGYGRDYRMVWAWCAELLAGVGVDAATGAGKTSDPEIRAGERRPASVGVERETPSGREWTVGRLFAVATYAVLALPVSEDVAGVDRNTRALADEHAAIAAYLAFPLLEQVLRASCHRHFGPAGRIVKPFDTPGQRSNRHYYIEGGTCSSIGDLLWLFRHHYAPSQIGAVTQREHGSTEHSLAHAFAVTTLARCRVYLPSRCSDTVRCASSARGTTPPTGAAVRPSGNGIFTATTPSSAPHPTPVGGRNWWSPARS